MRPSIPLILLSYLLLFLPQTRSQAVKQKYNISEINDSDPRHYRSLSTNSETVKILRANRTLSARVEKIYPFLETLLSIIASRRDRNDTLACNLRRIPWVTASLRNVRIRQVGSYLDVCQSRLDLNDAVVRNELNQTLVDSAKDLIVDVYDALWLAMREIPVIPDRSNEDLNWTRGAFPRRGWDLKRGGQTCSVDNLFGYRMNKKWFVEASVTNNVVDAFAPAWERQFMHEYVPQDLSESLELPWIRIGTDDVIENGKTFLTRWGGKTGLSYVSRMDFDLNPALVEALRLNELAVDQAEDAITPSNIAILALPMVMSLIPVAFLADLNTCAMLWYIIFTDVFSALPFLIKGIELLDSATIKRGEVVAYQMGNETLSQMEVWAAECRGQDSFRVLGIIFIVIAVCAITFGVALEVIAGVVMHRRREEKGHEASGPFGMAMFDTTAYSALGTANEDERDHQLSTEMARLVGREFEEENLLEGGRMGREGRAGALGDDFNPFDASYDDPTVLGADGLTGQRRRRWRWEWGRRRRGGGRGGGTDGFGETERPGAGGDSSGSSGSSRGSSYDTELQVERMENSGNGDGDNIVIAGGGARL